MFVAYNAALGLGTVIFNLLVVTDAINPSIAETEPLPEVEELLQNCKVEQGNLETSLNNN